jgi:hypothetical protein
VIKREERKPPHLIALINELMSTRNEFEAVNVIEFGRNLVSKEPTRATRRNSPRLNILRVAPHQVAEGSFVRDLLGTGNDPDLVNRTNLRAQSTVHAEDLAINDSS